MEFRLSQNMTIVSRESEEFNRDLQADITFGSILFLSKYDNTLQSVHGQSASNGNFVQ